MRAAAQRSPNVPCEVWALKGMQGAYDFVKEKSHAIGPNMSYVIAPIAFRVMFTHVHTGRAALFISS